MSARTHIRVRGGGRRRGRARARGWPDRRPELAHPLVAPRDLDLRVLARHVFRALVVRYLCWGVRERRGRGRRPHALGHERLGVVIDDAHGLPAREPLRDKVLLHQLAVRRVGIGR